VLSGAGAQIDTTTPNERLFFGIFATLAVFERELSRERTHAGLAAARARERKGGRPRKMTRSTVSMAMAATADQNANATQVAKELQITTTTLYAYINGNGSAKQPGRFIWIRDSKTFRLNVQYIQFRDGTPLAKASFYTY